MVGWGEETVEGITVKTIDYTYSVPIPLLYWLTLTKDRANTPSYIYRGPSSKKFPKNFIYFCTLLTCVLFMLHIGV